jgi:hypothetical protein
MNRRVLRFRRWWRKTTARRWFLYAQYGLLLALAVSTAAFVYMILRV